MSNSTAVKVQMIRYTDTVDGEQVCRDDLWAVSTSELAEHGLLPVPTELKLSTDESECSPEESAEVDVIWDRMVEAELRTELAEAKVIINELRVLIQNSLTVDRTAPIWEMVKEFERKYKETK